MCRKHRGEEDFLECARSYVYVYLRTYIGTNVLWGFVENDDDDGGGVVDSDGGTVRGEKT